MSRPERTSSELLREIVGDAVGEHESYSDQRLRQMASVNGVVGSANTRGRASTPEEFLVLLKHRFVSRPSLLHIVQHSLFETYLIAKAYELSDKRI